MSKAIAIAVNAVSEIFALEDVETGFCAVFDHTSGPTLEPGDVVDGDVLARTLCSFAHDKGVCIAYARTGPISRLKAILLVDGAPASEA
jgi:hypothetical protein